MQVSAAGCGARNGTAGHQLSVLWRMKHTSCTPILHTSETIGLCAALRAVRTHNFSSRALRLGCYHKKRHRHKTVPAEEQNLAVKRIDCNIVREIASTTGTSVHVQPESQVQQAAGATAASGRTGMHVPTKHVHVLFYLMRPRTSRCCDARRLRWSGPHSSVSASKHRRTLDCE
jgi:hypothetical protein